MNERILVIGHGHPEHISGGGEIAAYSCWKAYSEMPNVEAACFLARGDTNHDVFEGAISGRLTRYRENQYLWHQGLSDPFMMRAANLHEVVGHFAELVRALKPTVVHAHHYFMLGLEYLKVLKDIDPNIRIVLTLHEYMAICPNSGLMMKPDGGALCRSGAYDHHYDCAPDRSPEDHWLRYYRFQTYFNYVDHFVAPSEFLKERYVEWGLRRDRIRVIRNGVIPRARIAPRELQEGETRNRFAFFGQINPHKGVDVVLRALALMSRKRRKGLRFEIHGANLDRQPESYRDMIAKLLEPLEEEGVATMIGPYTQDELPDRMAEIDWVMVPSIWYENAPLVIQEAFSIGRPVITTNIGGMREAVQHDKTGYCLPRASVPAMSDAMSRLAENTTKYDRLVNNLPSPPTWKTSAGRHMKLFASLSKEAA